MPIQAFDASRQILTPANVPFLEVLGGFERAAAWGCREFNLQVAGYPVRIRVAGDAWAGIVAASMGHLRRSDAAVHEPALTVDVWDAQETGVVAPRRVEPDDTAPPILM